MSVDLVAGSNVTVNWNRSSRTGNVVCISVSITTNASIAKESQLLSGYPSIYSMSSAQMFMAAYDANQVAYELCWNESGIYSKVSIPSGLNIRISFCYITANV